MKCLLTLLAVLGTAVSLHAGAIHEAAREGNLELVRALVGGTPSAVNARDKGTTPLHEAARGGHVEVVKFLLSKGANVNSTDISGVTPLRLALGYRRVEVADVIRQAGGLEKAVTSTSQKPAAPVVATPQPRTSTPALPDGSMTPSSLKAAPALPRATEATAARAPAPTTPPAVVSNTPPPREMLAVIYPIHEAARVGDAEQIKFLLKSFPDLIESTDEKGNTPLHIAVAGRQLAAAQTLVGLRAKVNARNETGVTPLHLAARTSDLRITELLLTNRADVNARDSLDATPLLAAMQPAEKEEFQPVNVAEGQKFSATQKRVAIAEMHQQQLAIARQLIARGADVNARTRAGVTALIEAVRLRNLPMVELLLRSGADANAVDSTGNVTPLHIAAGRGLTNLVTTLLNAKAALNATDARGETPFGYALREGHVAVATILKQRGAHTGAAKALSSVEQSLVDYYQRTENSLQRASVSDKTRIILDMTATRSDAEKIFPRHGAVAGNVMEEIRKQIKAHKPLGDAEQGKEIWRVRTEPPSLQAQDWLNRGWINREIPVLSLVVDRVGGTSRPGDYCFVNQRWVLLPPLNLIAAQQQSAAAK